MIGAPLTIETLVVKMITDISAYQSGLMSAEAILRTVTMNINRSMAVFTTRLSEGLLSTITEFDDMMSKIMSISDSSSDDLRKDIQKTITGISSQSLTAPMDLAKAYYELTRASLDTAQATEALRVVERFSVVNMLEAGNAARQLVQVQRSFGLSLNDAVANADELRRIGDVITAVHIRSQIPIEGLMHSLMQIGTVARFSNQSLESSASVLGALTLVGNNAGESLRTLRMMMEEFPRLDLHGQGINASGGHTGPTSGRGGFQIGHRAIERGVAPLHNAVNAISGNTAAWQRLNISMFDVEGKMIDMPEAILRINHAFEGMTDQQKRSNLVQLGFGRLTVDAMIKIMESSDAIDILSNSIRNSNGLMETMYAERMNSLSGQAKIMSNNLKSIALAVGNYLVPWLKVLNNIFISMFKWFGNLSEETKKIIFFIIALVAALMTLVYMKPLLDKLCNTLYKLFTLPYNMIIAGYIGIASALRKIDKIYARISSKISTGGFYVLIGLLTIIGYSLIGIGHALEGVQIALDYTALGIRYTALGIRYLWTAFGMTGKAIAAWGWIKSTISSLPGFIRESLIYIQSLITIWSFNISRMISALPAAFLRFSYAAGATFGKFLDYMEIGLMRGAYYAGVFVGTLTRGFTAIGRGFSSLWNTDTIASAISWIWGGIKRIGSAINTATNLLPNFAIGWDLIKDGIGRVWEGLRGMARASRGMWEAMSWNSFYGWLTGFKYSFAIFRDGIRNISNGVRTFINAFTDMPILSRGFMGAMYYAGVLTGKIMRLGPALSNGLGYLKSFGSYLWNASKSAADLLFNLGKASLLKIGSIGGSIIGGVASAIPGAFMMLVNIIGPLLLIVAVLGTIALGAALISDAIFNWIGDLDEVEVSWESIWEAVQEAGWVVFGFFYNFQENFNKLLNWVRTNWNNVFLDLGSVTATVFENVWHNIALSFKQIFKSLMEWYIDIMFDSIGAVMVFINEQLPEKMQIGKTQEEREVAHQNLFRELGLGRFNDPAGGFRGLFQGVLRPLTQNPQFNTAVPQAVRDAVSRIGREIINGMTGRDQQQGHTKVGDTFKEISLQRFVLDQGFGSIAPTAQQVNDPDLTDVQRQALNVLRQIAGLPPLPIVGR